MRQGTPCRMARAAKAPEWIGRVGTWSSAVSCRMTFLWP
jgi:hypothetical protein